MKLPPVEYLNISWKPDVLGGWESLKKKASRLESRVGQSDAFEQVVNRLRQMAQTGRFDDLGDLLKKRMAARALTQMWADGEPVGQRLLKARLLDYLVKAQQPRLGRVPILHLIKLYFHHFDRLDKKDPACESGLRSFFEVNIQEQLRRLPETKVENSGPDTLSILQREGHWLLSLDGPKLLAEKVQAEGTELASAFNRLGLNGFDNGRYADICRAHFYLETLNNLPVGQWHDVLDELLKPEVNKAPFEGEKRIGHAALEILIDRAGEDPGEAWQNFILNLAGDPRIASSAPNYREWWKPLGEERISKVRGWLSKEDLRLFLQALEQYGEESGNRDLQRMFPARKYFLEGLYRLKLIRNSRLMLGRTAEYSVKRILGDELKTSYVKMSGTLNDKAVIYLDCGDFYLVEGSHSFKLWIYLAHPSSKLTSYDIKELTHHELTVSIPRDYKNDNPGLPYEAIVHNGTWQRKAFDFFANQGISLDIEQLLSPSGYRAYVSAHGIPVVKSKERLKDVVSDKKDIPIKRPIFKGWSNSQYGRDFSEVDNRAGLETKHRSSEDEKFKSILDGLSPKGLKVLNFFERHPDERSKSAAYVLRLPPQEVNALLHGELKRLCVRDPQFRWRVLEPVSKLMNH